MALALGGVAMIVAQVQGRANLLVRDLRILQHDTYQKAVWHLVTHLNFSITLLIVIDFVLIAVRVNHSSQDRTISWQILIDAYNNFVEGCRFLDQGRNQSAFDQLRHWARVRSAKTLALAMNICTALYAIWVLKARSLIHFECLTSGF